MSIVNLVMQSSDPAFIGSELMSACLQHMFILTTPDFPLEIADIWRQLFRSVGSTNISPFMKSFWPIILSSDIVSRESTAKLMKLFCKELRTEFLPTLLNELFSGVDIVHEEGLNLILEGLVELFSSGRSPLGYSAIELTSNLVKILQRKYKTTREDESTMTLKPRSYFAICDALISLVRNPNYAPFRYDILNFCLLRAFYPQEAKRVKRYSTLEDKAMETKSVVTLTLSAHGDRAFKSAVWSIAFALAEEPWQGHKALFAEVSGELLSTISNLSMAPTEEIQLNTVVLLHSLLKNDIAGDQRAKNCGADTPKATAIRRILYFNLLQCPVAPKIYSFMRGIMQWSYSHTSLQDSVKLLVCVKCAIDRRKFGTRMQDDMFILAITHDFVRTFKDETIATQAIQPYGDPLRAVEAIESEFTDVDYTESLLSSSSLDQKILAQIISSIDGTIEIAIPFAYDPEEEVIESATRSTIDPRRNEEQLLSTFRSYANLSTSAIPQQESTSNLRLGLEKLDIINSDSASTVGSNINKPASIYDASPHATVRSQKSKSIFQLLGKKKFEK